jgi:cytochrome P450
MPLHPPGPKGRSTLRFFGGGSMAGMLEFFEDLARRYGPLSSFRILHKRIYFLNDPNLIEQVLVIRQHEFVRDSGATVGRELVGDALLTREEPLHKERRRILQPAFHRDQVASYAEAMTSETARLSREWNAKTSLNIQQEMRRLTLAIVGATLFGADFRDSAEQIAQVLESVTRKGATLVPAVALLEPLLLAYRRIAPNAKSLFFRDERQKLDEIVSPVLQRHRTTTGNDVLSLILAQRENGRALLSDEDAKNEIVTFVLAGHETTASALTWTWYLLAKHPVVRQKLDEELARILGEAPPSLQTVPDLAYTSRIFQETLRLYPPALVFARRPKHDLTLGGYTIRRGASIFLSPYVTQRSSLYFADPEVFDPDRWLDPSHPEFAYFPFGGGAKMCIGEPFARLEAVLVLAGLAQRWRLELSDTNEVSIGKAAVLEPARPIWMQPSARAANVQNA